MTEHNELLVQSIPCATLVNQSKHQSDNLFERKCLVLIICDQVITLCLQLDGSDEIKDVWLNHQLIENSKIVEACLALVDSP